MDDELARRRGKVTEEHAEEARRLKELWLESEGSRARRGVKSQEAFGQEFKIGNQSAVGFFLNGQTALSMKAARGFARGIPCDIADFSPRLAAAMLEFEHGVPLTADERELLIAYRSLPDSVSRAKAGAYIAGLAGRYEDAPPIAATIRKRSG